jgi:phosphoglycerate-specific signal transduction histidine kinase
MRIGKKFPIPNSKEREEKKMIEAFIFIGAIALYLLYITSCIIIDIVSSIKYKIWQKKFSKIQEKYKDYFDLDNTCRYLNEEIAMLKNKITDLQLAIRKNLDELPYLIPEDEENAKQKNLEYKYKIKEIKTVLREKTEQFEDLTKIRNAYRNRISEKENFSNWE